MNLLNNVNENFTNLQNDFIGITIHPLGLLNYFINILITIVLFYLFYFLGKRIKEKFFSDVKNYYMYINIGLGFIVTATGIGLLGILSLLTPIVLISYVLLLWCIALNPLPKGIFSSRLIKKNIRNFIDSHNKYILLGVLLFIVLSFLRLSLPESTEDGYHTDLPRLYLQTQTTIHETRDLLHVIPYPQLAEMIYMIPIFLDYKDAVRFIHFGFYLLIILLLFSFSRNKDSTFASYAPLLFASAPIVIRYSTSQYTDFFMVFCLLLSILQLKKNSSNRLLILSGILSGGALAVKLWLVVYLPAIVLYLLTLNRHLPLRRLFAMITVFSLSAFLVPLLWYVRAFIITQNPVYPIFSKLEYLDRNLIPPEQESSVYFDFNEKMFMPENLIVFSPLFFLGILLIFLNIKKVITVLKKSSLSFFVAILFLEHMVVEIFLGRHLLAWYTITGIVISAGIFLLIPKIKLIKYLFLGLYGVIFSYYLLNTLLILPYGFGWADTDKYLTRVLFRDNANYFDFDQQFDKHITKRDFVVTHGFVSFYYADFSYTEVGYIFSDSNRSFDLLKQKKVTRLLINGGDIEWFCKRLELTNCSKDKVKLLATYPKDVKKYNLYEIKY